MFLNYTHLIVYICVPWYPRGDRREILRSQSLSALWVPRQSSGYRAWWQCLYPLDSRDFNQPGNREGQFPSGLGYFVSTSLFLSVWPGLREIEAESHRTAQRCTLSSGYVMPTALGTDLSAVSGLKSGDPTLMGNTGRPESELPPVASAGQQDSGTGNACEGLGEV